MKYTQTPIFNADVVQIPETPYHLVWFYGVIEKGGVAEEVEGCGYRLATEAEYAEFAQKYEWLTYLFPILANTFTPRKSNDDPHDYHYLVLKR